jgi:hypothetical protein
MGASFLPYLLVLCLLFTGIVMKPARFRWVIWPMMASLVYPLFFKSPTNDPPTDAALRSSFVAYLFTASDYILLTDVQHEFRKDGQSEPITIASFWARLQWGLELFFGPRGVGWDHEPRGVLPPRPHSTRGRFILSQVFWLAIYLLCLDVTQFVTAYTSVFAKESIPTALQAWHWRFLGTLLIAIGGATLLSITHTILSIMSVATWTSEPKGWPHFFGKWSDAYTIRKFWG